MPEGPLGGKRLTNIPPGTRESKEDLYGKWAECPTEERPHAVCEAVKDVAVAIISDQGWFAEYETLEDINSGACTKVASNVYSKLPYTEQYETMFGDHVWIVYNSMHYDAEAPQGVDDPLDLPFFKRIDPRMILDHIRLDAEHEGVKPPDNMRDAIENVSGKY